MKTIVRGFKYTIKPDAVQVKTLDSMLRDCRSLRNHVLRFMKKRRSTSLPWHQEFTIKRIVKIGEIMKFLHFKNSKVAGRAFTTVCELLYTQHKSIDLLKQKPPSYKGVSSDHAIHLPRECVKIVEGKLSIAGVEGLIDVKWTRGFSFEKIVKVIVSRDAFKNYSISFDVRCNVVEDHGDQVIGIDVNVADVVVTSEGVKFSATPLPKEVGQRIDRWLKMLPRFKYGSRAWKKVISRIQIFTKKADDIRKTYFYQIAHSLADQAKIFAVERLDIAKIITGARYQRSITMSAWGQLNLILKNVAEKRKVIMVYAGLYYPSTRLASCCGYLHQGPIATDVREWECPQCNTVLDRDVNAAINIKNFAVESLKAYKGRLDSVQYVIC